jgi:ABC-type dipeptide/oligopeptide/nickel transport system permease subunit
VRAHGYWEFVLRRLVRDRTALASLAVIALIVFATFGLAPILSSVLGHGPNDTFPYAIDENLSPAGPFSRVPDAQSHVPGGPPEQTTLFVLGADGTLGRDELLRVLYGGRVSLMVALGATAVSLTIGFLLGAAAALRGGVMAFPLLLFLMLLGATVSDRFDNITVGGLLPQGVVSLAVLIGAFTWFYPARIVRAEILSLRNREFVEAARMTGAGTVRIIRAELLPHVAPLLLVYGSLIMATNIILEASITFVGVGLRLPTASWGTLLADTWGSLLSSGDRTLLRPETQFLLTLWPSLCIFATVLAFNLLGDAVRRAVDPGRTA